MSISLWIFYPSLIILGLIFGSFFNVCIYRIPREESIVWPGSHCPLCNHPLSFSDNLPLVSFLLLRGSCRYCQGHISFYYPMIELVTALITLLLGLKFGFSLLLVQGFILCSALIVISFIDLSHQIIPDVISYPGMIVGLVFSWLTGSPGWFSSLLGLLIGGGLLYLIALGYEFLAKKEGMGGGDIKLLAMIGAFLGWPGVLITIFVGSLLGTLVGLSLMLIWKKDRTYAVPFGPFLSLGAIAYLFFGNAFLNWYLS